MRERRDAYRVLVEKPEGKRPLGRPRHTWKGNIKMYLPSASGQVKVAGACEVIHLLVP
jgi:hypothetical protein